MTKTTRVAYQASICEAQAQLERLAAAIDLCSDLPELTDADVTSMRAYANSLSNLANIVEGYARVK